MKKIFILKNSKPIFSIKETYIGGLFVLLVSVKNKIFYLFFLFGGLGDCITRGAFSVPIRPARFAVLLTTIPQNERVDKSSRA
jgi:hypothetical protein